MIVLSMRVSRIHAAASLLCAAFVLLSCGGRSVSSGSGNDTVAFRYSRLVRIENSDGYSVARIANPWRGGEVLHSYVLVPYDEPLPEKLPEGTVVRTPLRRAVVFTSVHGGLLASLGRLDAVAGVCDYRYILLPAVRSRVESGEIKDMGMSVQPDVERIVGVRPDALLVSPFEGSGGYGKLETAGVPLIECADYMESSPLARAEWMRFYGILFGCRREADSLFSVVEKNYLSLSKAAAGTRSRLRVMCDLMQGAAWYVPGGRSTIGCAIADAGGDYVFGGDTVAGSVGKTFEAVYNEAHDADVWIIRWGKHCKLTYELLKKEREAYSRFRPWKERRIYACNTLEVPFFDQSPFRPDYLLNDFVRICHPELSAGTEFHYFHPVE